MSAGNQLAVYLPYVLGALLLGGALFGSFLGPAKRAQAERRVLLPLYLVLALAYLAMTLRKHDWLLIGIGVMVALRLALSLYRRLRDSRPGVQT